MDTINPDINNTKRFVPNKEINTKDLEIMQAIGLKLKSIREANKLTKVQLCNDIGISRTTYMNLEEGSVYWNIKILLLVLDYYKISHVDFFREL